MAHDFIIAKGKLSDKQAMAAMEECVSFKHYNVAQNENLVTQVQIQ